MPSDASTGDAAAARQPSTEGAGTAKASEQEAAAAPAQEPAAAQPAAAAETLALADGALRLTVPAGWKVKKPESRIIEHELAVPPAGDDKDPGRVTIMGAGGSIRDNIDRWAGQFSQPDGSDSQKALKETKAQVAGLDVVLIDISGTYKDSRGPFSGVPAVERPEYRMLAAIIQGKGAGNYFVKFYGPRQTVADNAAAFQKFVDSLEVK